MSHLRTLSASQGHSHKYEDLNWEMNSCNANIYFNQKYLRKELTAQKYERIKLPNTSPASKFTQTKAMTLRIKDEIIYILFVITSHVFAACPAHHMVMLLVFGKKDDLRRWLGVSR